MTVCLCVSVHGAFSLSLCVCVCVCVRTRVRSAAHICLGVSRFPGSVALRPCSVSGRGGGGWHKALVAIGGGGVAFWHLPHHVGHTAMRADWIWDLAAIPEVRQCLTWGGPRSPRCLGVCVRVCVRARVYFSSLSIFDLSVFVLSPSLV